MPAGPLKTVIILGGFLSEISEIRLYEFVVHTRLSIAHFIKEITTSTIDSSYISEHLSPS